MTAVHDLFPVSRRAKLPRERDLHEYLADSSEHLHGADELTRIDEAAPRGAAAGTRYSESDTDAQPVITLLAEQQQTRNLEQWLH